MWMPLSMLPNGAMFEVPGIENMPLMSSLIKVDRTLAILVGTKVEVIIPSEHMVYIAVY